MDNKKGKLQLSNKLAFAVGDFFGGGSFNIINFMYPGFLALTVGLSPFWIGFIMFVARVWDAVSDPLMGRISDGASNQKFGKRRVFIVISAPLIVLAMFLMFYPFAFESEALRILAVLFSYIFFCTVQTMFMIPYYALSSELSYDYQERASANSFRLGFSIFSSILCVSLPGIIVNMVGGDKGYIVMSVTFGLLFGACMLTTGLFTKEEIITPPVKKAFSFVEFTKFLKIRPFTQYLGLLLCTQMTMAIMSSLYFFFIDFYICRDITSTGTTSALGLIGAALMFSMQIVALPFYLKLINKTSKAFTFRVGGCLWVLMGLLFFTLQPGAPAWLILLYATLVGFGISGPGLVPHTMFGDVVDVAKLITGERNEGAMSGLVNFVNKIAQAIGLSLVMGALGFFQFTEKQAGGPAVLTQPESAQMAIRIIMCFAPLIFISVGMLISKKYIIDAKKQQEVKNALETNDEKAIEQLKKEFI